MENVKDNVTHNDESRDWKLTIGFVLAVIVVLLGGTYFLWSWMSSPPPEQSKVDLARLGTASRGTAAETPHFRELLTQANKEGELEAQKKNLSFVASIPFEQEPLPDSPSDSKKKNTPKPQQPRPTPSSADSRSARQDGGNGSGGERNEKRSAALMELLKEIKAPAEPRAVPTGIHVANNPYGGDGNGLEARSWSDSLNQRSASKADRIVGSAEGSIAPIEVVPPYWRGPGIIDIGVDSDNSTTPVLGRMPAGRYAGAVLKAPDGAKLTGDGVVIHFQEMAFNGVNYKVDAYALQDDTLLANVATDVNNRYMSRIVLPALLSGIGSAGGLYAQANTQVVSNGFNTEVVRPGLPDGAAVVGSILGGGASQAAKVLGEDASRIPPKQVLVTRGQVVAIQFMRGVYAGDAISPGQSRLDVMPAVPASQATNDKTPVTQAEWRSQALSRIQAQRQFQEGQK